MNTNNLTIANLLDMTPRERDRVAAEFMNEFGYSSEGGVWPNPLSQYWHGHQHDPPQDHYPMWAKYSEDWNHAGRLLEALPLQFRRNPNKWFRNQGFTVVKFGAEDNMMSGDYTIEDPLRKESIVLAACICEINNIKPKTKNN